MNNRPFGSKASPDGCARKSFLLRVTFAGIVLDVKLVWPRTRSAAGSFVALPPSYLAGKRNTRLLPGSETHRLPCASKARPARNVPVALANARVRSLGPARASLGERPFRSF